MSSNDVVFPCLQVPEECPASVVQLIEDCMEKPPEGRPTARQAYDIIKECADTPEALQARRPRLSGFWVQVFHGAGYGKP